VRGFETWLLQFKTFASSVGFRLKRVEFDTLLWSYPVILILIFNDSMLLIFNIMYLFRQWQNQVGGALEETTLKMLVVGKR